MARSLFLLLAITTLHFTLPEGQHLKLLEREQNQVIHHELAAPHLLAEKTPATKSASAKKKTSATHKKRTTSSTKPVNTTSTMKSAISNTAASTVAPYSLPSTPAQQSGPLFQPLATTAPPSSLFGTGVPHPLKPVNLPSNPSSLPIGTNKWYNQLLLPPVGTDPVYPLPYAVAYLNGTSILSQQSSSAPVGLGIMHATASQRVVGPGSPAKYYLNPLTIAVSLGATEITSSNVQAALTGWSELTATFSMSPGVSPTASTTTQRLSIPLSRGAAYITALYSNLTPVFQSSLAITSLVAVSGTVNGFTKHRVSFNDGSTYLFYSAAMAGTSVPPLTLVQSGQMGLKISTGQKWSGVVQVVKVSAGWTAGGTEETKAWDKGVGVWVEGATVFSGAAGSGVYGFDWDTAGPRSSSVAPLIYALPHHVASVTSPSSPVSPSVTLQSRVNGVMTLYSSKTWSFKEDVSVVGKYSVLPTNPTFTTQTKPTSDDLEVLRSVATKEMQTDFTAEANLDSWYFAGKKVAKQALQCLTLFSILADSSLASACLSKARTALSSFASNKPTSAAPLKYETTWKGIISSAYLTSGNENVDFGNGVYNDHHFHWGYFVHAAGVLASLDTKGEFAAQVKPFVQALIRDANNPSALDTYSTFSRHFDWWVGHSWATGLQSSLDGKNEESGSEDVNFFYGMKVWAEATSQPNLAALANLQLAIQRRSLNTYFFMTDSNTAQPSTFIKNRVPGITFENKVDYTTFFSDADEAIHMIQAIPTIPLMPYWRDLTFIRQEWSDSGASPQISVQASTLSTGYRTLLYTQYADLQPRQIADGLKANRSAVVLDDGASLTWSLGFALSQLGN